MTLAGVSGAYTGVLLPSAATTITANTNLCISCTLDTIDRTSNPDLAVY